MRAAGLDLDRLGPAARALIAEATASGAIALGPDSPLHDVRRGQRRDEEHEAQAALFAWATRNEGRIPELAHLFAIPNAGGMKGGFKSNLGVVRRNLAEGVRPGVPDCFLAWRASDHAGCFVEMKSATGRLKPTQREWLDRLAMAGYAVHVCRSAAEARSALCAYLGVADPEGDTLTTEA